MVVIQLIDNAMTRKRGEFMLFWIILWIVVYLLIGVGLLIWTVKTDPWGSLILEIWWIFIIGYPIFIVLSLFNRFK